MSDRGQSIPPDFDDHFLQAIAKWKEQHQIRDDDTILLLLDLFRIHQSHWDEIRQRQIPALEQFATDIAVLTEATKILKTRMTKEGRNVDRATALVATVAAALAGFLIGKFL